MIRWATAHPAVRATRPPHEPRRDPSADDPTRQRRPGSAGRAAADRRSVASSGAFTLGAEVEAFEAEFAAYCEAAHAVGVSSGTDALALGLRALGIGPGDEVIVPANSFIATAEAVTLVGATPRLVDVDPDTQLLTAQIVRTSTSTRARAASSPSISTGAPWISIPSWPLAREAGIAVLEDACQAHGARYRGRRVGSIGDAGCFSFYPAKNLGAWGDGGALVTSDPQIADRVKLLRSHGERPRYHHLVSGTTARLDALQAAILRVKLRRLDASNAARRRVAASLTRALEGSIMTPAAPPDGHDHVFHQFVVRSDRRDEPPRRSSPPRGSRSAIHYPVPIHLTGRLCVARDDAREPAGRRSARRRASARCRSSRP